MRIVTRKMGVRTSKRRGVRGVEVVSRLGGRNSIAISSRFRSFQSLYGEEEMY